MRQRMDRRGIILLFVLALLALFSLVALSYVIVARQARRGAQSAAVVERRGTSGADLLDLALGQIVRGTDDPQSVLGPHSLLEDLYGHDQQRGTVKSYNPSDRAFNPGNGG